MVRSGIVECMNLMKGIIWRRHAFTVLQYDTKRHHIAPSRPTCTKQGKNTSSQAKTQVVAQADAKQVPGTQHSDLVSWGSSVNTTVRWQTLLFPNQMVLYRITYSG